MKFKLDENFGTRTQQLFKAAGHEVKTVREQGLLDFADVTRFSPTQTDGIVVIRVPLHPSITLLEQLVVQFLQTLTQMSVEKKLWIVESGRIRVHESETEEEI